MMKKIAILALVACAASGVRAAEPDSVGAPASQLLMPLVFPGHSVAVPDSVVTPALGQGADAAAASWIDRARQQRRNVSAQQYRMMMDHPGLVPYSQNTLPEPPKEVQVDADPVRHRLQVDVAAEPADVAADTPLDALLERQQIKARHWLHSVNASLQFSQAYISGNWYQGGENNVNVLGDFQWTVNLNQKLHENLLFENTLRYKVGVMTAQGDSLRNYSISEDLFQINSTFGYKAVKNWYYSAKLLFKTQMWQAFASNSNTVTASLLSPAELNIGLGMTYSYKDKQAIHDLSISIAPLSYNLKYCRDIDKLNPTTFGIDAGHHSKHSFGSNVEAKYTWKISPAISWTSRLYAFTNYSYVQGDWENTLDFSATRHLSTKLYVHLRYDKSRPWDEDWRYFQLKEILSFGLTYRFSTT